MTEQKQRNESKEAINIKRESETFTKVEFMPGAFANFAILRSRNVFKSRKLGHALNYRKYCLIPDVRVRIRIFCVENWQKVFF